MTPSEHNQQLLIDLANAHKESCELRDENRRLTIELIDRDGDFGVGIAIGALLAIFAILFVSCL